MRAATLAVLLLLGAAMLAAPVPTAAQTPDPTGGAGPSAAAEPPAAEGGEGSTGQEAAPAAAPLPELPRDPLRPDAWKGFGDRLVDRAADLVPGVIRALVVLLLFLILYLMLARVVGGVLRRTQADPALGHIVQRLLKYSLMLLAVIMAISQLGFEVASVLAGLGVAGLAVGLAAQDTLANLIAGFTILWDRPFRTGDNVTIAGTFGQVMEIGLRSTRIRTVEQLDAVLPNKEVINQEIINHTLNPRLRLTVPLGIAYKEDSREARKVLLEAVSGHPLIAAEPAPTVVMVGLGDSSVDLELRVWLKDAHSERQALCEMLELSKIALDEAGIEIPFPQRTLHLGDDRVLHLLEGGRGQAAKG